MRVASTGVFALGQDVWSGLTTSVSRTRPLGQDVWSGLTTSVSRPRPLGQDVWSGLTTSVSRPLGQDVCCGLTTSVSRPRPLGQDVCSGLTTSVSRPRHVHGILWPVNTPSVSDFRPCWRFSSPFSKTNCGTKWKMRFTFAFGHPFNRMQVNSGTDTVSLLTALRWSLVRELSTSSKAMQYDLHRSDVSKSGHRKLLFDTHALVRLLEDSGLTVKQAEVIINMLVKSTNSNMDIMYSDMVTKTQQEIMLQKVMSHIAAVKKDMIILEKSEFSTLLAENERIKVELAQLNMQLSDVMNKVRLDNKLDMNFEKIKMKETKAEHERKLLQTRHGVIETLTEQDRHVTQNNVKIDTEVAGLKTMLESHKLDSIKYLAGSVFTCLTVVLGFLRIWM